MLNIIYWIIVLVLIICIWRNESPKNLFLRLAGKFSLDEDGDNMDVKRTAKQKLLFAVDCQNDFMQPTGKLYVEDSVSLIEPIVEESKKAEYGFVVATRDWHTNETAEFIANGGPMPVHCMAATYGAELLAGLKYDVCYNKDQYNIGADETFMRNIHCLLVHVKEIVVVGVATDFCVFAAVETLIDVIKTHNFDIQITVKKDLIKGIDNEKGIAMLEELMANNSFVTFG